MFYVKLFGTPSLTWDGGRFDLSRRQARALLYRLAAEVAPVSRSQLSFLFWPDLDDKKARRNLSRLINLTRQGLPAPDLLTAGQDSVGLSELIAQSDTRQFERLVDRGDEAALERAVALYHGPFLAGFSLANSPEFELWAGREQGRLEQAYLAALTTLLDQKAASGDLESAIGFGRRYLETDDLAEEVHRRLIELYITSGDRAAALRQYETCVAILERELGVAPLPETRGAYEVALSDQVLPDAASTAAPEMAPVWTVLPSLDLPLIGRQEALSQLARAFGRAGSGGSIFISGEPGIGKSRLLRDFAAANQDRLVLTGNSYAGTRELPYQPIVEVLRQALAQRDLWSGIRPIWLAETSAILPEMASHFAGLPAPIGVEPDQAQVRLFEALSQVVTGLAARRPLLLCLDDLHWADEATLGWLIYLTGRLSGSGVCIIATYRTHEAEPLADLRRSMRRANLQAEIALSGLSIQAITAILDHLPASGSQPLAPKIHQATAGNAFFVLETIRNLLESDQLADPTADLPLPPTVQQAVRGRLERLDPLSRQMLDAAAILSPEITIELLEPVAGRSEAEAVDGVESLLARQLLAESGGQLQFQHELARIVVYEDLSLWRRRLLHRRAAETLAEIHRGRSEQAAQIAQHYEAAGDIALARDFYQRAAAAAQAQYAYQEASHYLRRAIDLLSDEMPVEIETVDALASGRLYEALADNLRILADFEAAEAAYRRALALGPAGSSLWRADTQRKLAAVLKPDLRFEEADELYTRSLANLNDATEDPRQDKRRQWLITQLDRLDLYYGQARVDDMVALTAEVEPVVRDLDIPYLWSKYYAAVTRMRCYLERFSLSAETAQIGRDRLGHALESGNVREIAEQQFGLGFVLLWSGQLEEALETLEKALTATEEIGHLYVTIQCLTYLSILHRLRGDVREARQYLNRSLQIAAVQKHRYYVAVDHANKAWLAYKEADWGKALEEAWSALSLLEGTVYPFAWLASWIILAHCLETGDIVGAAGAAADMLSPDQQRLPDDVAAALETATTSSEVGAIHAALTTALNLAEDHGYL